MIDDKQVQIKDKFCLTIEEASAYFNIGDKKLRKIVSDNLDSGCINIFIRIPSVPALALSVAENTISAVPPFPAHVHAPFIQKEPCRDILNYTIGRAPFLFLI